MTPTAVAAHNADLLEEMVATEAWAVALQAIAKRLSNERTMVQTDLRRTVGHDDVSLFNAIRAQARIDGIIDAVCLVYSEAKVEMPATVEHLLKSPGKLR
jgi:hypothetical protein